MNTLDQQYQKVLIFLIVVILAGSGYWILKHFRPALFLGEPDLVVGAEADHLSPSQPTKSAPKSQQLSPLPEIVVHVTGAVQLPGVYRLSPGVRVQDAIEKAGGGTDQADVHRLNLAAKVRDEQQIYVPEIPQAISPASDVQRTNPHINPASSAPPVLPLQSLVPAPTLTDSPLINLNTATSEQLQTLPRIGPAMARRIIKYRETYGGFSSVDDLTNVKGIGEKTLEKIRHLVIVY